MLRQSSASTKSNVIESFAYFQWEPVSRRSALGSIATCSWRKSYLHRLRSPFLCSRIIFKFSPCPAHALHSLQEQDSSLLFVSFRVVKIFSFCAVGNLFAHSFLIKHRVVVINGANLRTLSGRRCCFVTSSHRANVHHTNFCLNTLGTYFSVNFSGSKRKLSFYESYFSDLFALVWWFI